MHRICTVLLAPLLAIGLIGCRDGATDSDDLTTETDGGGSGEAFPVTIEHAFGSTTIDEEPTRVVAWGWASADAAIALDVIPVAIPFQEYGGNENGLLPWIEEALQERGAAIPEILPNTEEPPFEAIAAARPDVILAPYSGITESDYNLLSEIAATVAYPGEAWATPWKETIQIVGQALGRAEQTEELLDAIDAEVAEAAEAHPEFEGKTVAVISDSEGIFYVYKAADPRVQFTLDLGFDHAPSVDELANGDETFYYTISYEQVDELTSDVLVSYSDTEEQAEAFASSPHAQLMEQVRQGAVAHVVGPPLVAAVGPPTALSLTWGLGDYVELLSEAALAADG